MDNKYYNKSIKYQEKYLNLIKQSGGNPDDDENISLFELFRMVIDKKTLFEEYGTEEISIDIDNLTNEILSRCKSIKNEDDPDFYACKRFQNDVTLYDLFTELLNLNDTYRINHDPSILIIINNIKEKIVKRCKDAYSNDALRMCNNI